MKQSENAKLRDSMTHLLRVVVGEPVSYRCEMVRKTKMPWCRRCERQGIEPCHVIKRSQSTLLYYDERNCFWGCRRCHADFDKNSPEKRLESFAEWRYQDAQYIASKRFKRVDNTRAWLESERARLQAIVDGMRRTA